MNIRHEFVMYQIMNTLKTNIKWLDELLPQGIQIPGSTLISGPGGTGKPLVELAFVAGWLHAGGSLIAIPLQYPTYGFFKSTLKKVYNTDPENFPGKVVYIQFDHTADNYLQTGENTLIANMANPEIWDKTIKAAESIIKKDTPGIMVYGSALNLLLLSPIYKNLILEKLKDIIEKGTDRTYFFSVSTSILSNEIRILENAAKNLISTRMDGSGKFYLKISRLKGVVFSDTETEVPIPDEILDEMNELMELDNCICYYCHCKKWGSYFNNF